MTFGKHIRVAGSVVIIVAFFMHSLILNLVGLAIMAIGGLWQVDSLERRVEALEAKGSTDEKN